ncbi:peptidoglycan-binding protein, partial [Clostridium algidicarnis]|nr:peptidoglycan-binding protein [Clostridium algidicarnis]
KNGMTHVVYNTDKGPNTKSGYVKYEGGSGFNDSNIEIPPISHLQAIKEQYGISGKGRPLNVYKIGNGSKVLFAGFALHGWEDNWDNDGLALVNIANSLITRLGDYKSQNNGLHGWTVYIAPCMNPDGVIVRGTKDGPGRCAVTSRIDMNRCFPYNFTPQYSSRNYTGANSLGAPEARAIKGYLEKINSSSTEMIVLDFHGWMNFTQGNAEIGRYFGSQFGFGHNNGYSSGFFSSWASTLKNTKAVLIEYPTSTYSYSDVITGNYIGKTFNGIVNILKNNPGSSSEWIQKGDSWYYYENGLMVTGWKSINGSWYYLQSNGVMATGWNSINGSWYYLESSGVMATGWNSIDGSWYYLESNGAMATGWKSIDGSWYYLESSGAMATGLKSINDSWYYLESNGAMATGEIIMSGKTYHFDNSGRLYLILNKKITVDDIKQIQERLQKLKLFDGFISGYYDDLTKSAVRQFQLKYNVMPTYGVANEETIYAIKKSNPSISYILYDEKATTTKDDKLFKDTAEIRKKKYCKKYPYTEVQLIPVSSPQDFKNKWNNIGLDSKGNEIKVAVVELQFHGTVGDGPDEKGIGYMFVVDKKGNIVVSDKVEQYNKDTDIIISTLKSKKMDLLYFSSCNTGNPDVENVGNAFKKIVAANEIIAWDGGTIFNWDTGEDEPGAYRKTIDQIKSDQGTWYKYVDKDKDGIPLRDRKGRVWI